MRDKISEVLTSIFHYRTHLSDAENIAFLKEHIKDLQDASDVLVWMMYAPVQAEKQTGGSEAFLKHYGDLYSKYLAEIFALYPALVNKKLSFVADTQFVNTENPEHVSYYRKHSNPFPHNEGSYLVSAHAQGPALTLCTYKNYVLRTPWQFASFYKLEQFKAILEQQKTLDKTIQAGDDEFAVTCTNPFKRQQSLASIVRAADFLESLPNLIQQEMSDKEAGEVLVELLQKARHAKHNAGPDKQIAGLISQLLEDHPLLNINRGVAYADSLKHPDWTHRWSFDYPDSKLPYIRGYDRDVYGDPDGGAYLQFYGCTPLHIAALYDLKAIMEVLLNHPSVDVSLGCPYNYAKGASKEILHAANLKQFYREAVFTDKIYTDEISRKYKDVITPKEMRKYIEPMVTLVINRIHAETDLEKKFQILYTELKQLCAETALTSYLGKEVDMLKGMIDKELLVLMNSQATPAEPTGAPAITHRSINSAKNDLGQASTEPKTGFLGLFRRK